MEAVDAAEALRVFESSLSVTNWRLKAASKRRFETDIFALCTGLRPVIMLDYGGRMPELRERLCAFLKCSQKESSIFEHLRVMVVEDMIYLIHVRGIAELIRLTIDKDIQLHFVDIQQDPPTMITHAEQTYAGAQFLSIQQLFSSYFPTDVIKSDILQRRIDSTIDAETSASQPLVMPQSCEFIDLTRFMQDTTVTVSTLNGWLLGYPVVYLFGKESVENAICNLSTKPLHLFRILVHRNGTSNRGSSPEELMSFSVPYDLSVEGKDEPWAIAFLARMQARWQICQGVWSSLFMEVSSCYPQSIVL